MLDDKAPRWQSVGWVFFSVTTILCLIPGVGFFWIYRNPDEAFFVQIMAGLLVSMLMSSFITFGINGLLQRRMDRYFAAQRHAERKLSQKKKGKKGS